MIPVYQEHGWDCHLAAIASVLELPLEDMPQINPGELTSEEWHDAWNDWLSRFGLAQHDVTPGDGSIGPKGYCLGVAPSQKFPGVFHSIVCLNGVPHFDPQRENRPYSVEEVECYCLLVPLNPAVMVQLQREGIAVE